MILNQMFLFHLIGNLGKFIDHIDQVDRQSREIFISNQGEIWFEIDW